MRPALLPCLQGAFCPSSRPVCCRSSRWCRAQRSGPAAAPSSPGPLLGATEAGCHVVSIAAELLPGCPEDHQAHTLLCRPPPIQHRSTPITPPIPSPPRLPRWTSACASTAPTCAPCGMACRPRWARLSGRGRGRAADHQCAWLQALLHTCCSSSPPPPAPLPPVCPLHLPSSIFVL